MTIQDFIGLYRTIQGYTRLHIKTGDRNTDTQNLWNLEVLTYLKIEIKNEVTENEIKNRINVQTKYWHEC